MLAYIWAEDAEQHIGYQGHLPWKLPSDLAYFKKKTAHHPIVMGRKTFESFKGFLPQRQHIVLTTSTEFAKKYNYDERLTVVHSITELRKMISDKDEVFFVIGGAALFEQLMDDVDYLYVTKIKAVFKADTSMPPVDYGDFELVAKSDGPRDQKNLYDHEFRVYRRKQS
ncbi:dihydrofolate reductase [Liquorilactobacillus sucicola DSM 21376 = JCM 15457]|uniref:Dihydrofolate reductase n=1 Tax=Liquorilactobacillus sucicola DSM 21376 = JCM 15457 TaxID=1423806 RepID=A0A023CUH7_9LACO|nr:dihydrofolate reductase [Liquorilactobacillus sucicola]KRN05454.1 dihydrofolate reductase [Liquorilactobacillus sucicola DSM 21376 = JCM 15457]GAJ25532.1 dihydrofolate reductase [Liquorilactobacillus sucicola DSM 21376 = JCM 15457]